MHKAHVLLAEYVSMQEEFLIWIDYLFEEVLRDVWAVDQYIMHIHCVHLLDGWVFVVHLAWLFLFGGSFLFLFFSWLDFFSHGWKMFLYFLVLNPFIDKDIGIFNFLPLHDLNMWPGLFLAAKGFVGNVFRVEIVYLDVVEFIPVLILMLLTITYKWVVMSAIWLSHMNNYTFKLILKVFLREICCLESLIILIELIF